MDAKKRVKVAKYGGDDKYSWAVWVDGRPVVTGLSRADANYSKQRTIKNLEKAA